MNTTSKFSVEGMSCSGCTAAFGNVVRAIPEVEDFTVTLRPGEPSAVEVVHDDSVDPASLSSLMTEAGYPSTHDARQAIP